MSATATLIKNVNLTDLASAMAVNAAPVAPVAPVGALAVRSLSDLVLTRSQKKALAYAKALESSGEIDLLRQSGNKTDQAIGLEMHMQAVRQKARGNNNAIKAMIIARYGSDENVKNVAVPTDSKTATLQVWVASMGLAIKGNAESTEKAIASRQTVINSRFGDIFAMVAELA